VWVADVADAIVRVLTVPETRGEIYELGGPSIYTFKELLEFILRETGRRPLLVSVPFALASFKAFFLQIPGFILPVAPLLTMDQVTLLKSDNVVHEGARTLADLRIIPAAMEAIVPGYIWRFHPKGQFGRAERTESGTTA
jgi:NADH dehydrogenase